MWKKKLKKKKKLMAEYEKLEVLVLPDVEV